MVTDTCAAAFTLLFALACVLAVSVTSGPRLRRVLVGCAACEGAEPDCFFGFGSISTSRFAEIIETSRGTWVPSTFVTLATWKMGQRSWRGLKALITHGQ